MKHWTETSIEDFLYRITADFVVQLENKIQTESLNKSDLAQKLGVSKGRVSQIFNDPGNLNLKTIIKYTRALGMKIAIVAYDDNDPENERGPINSELFRICWENSGKPADFWSLQESRCTATNVAALNLQLNIAVYRYPRLNVTEQQHAETVYQGQDLNVLFGQPDNIWKGQIIATASPFDQKVSSTLH